MTSHHHTPDRAGDDYREWVVSYAELAALHALEIVGGRLMHKVGRAARHHAGPLRSVDRFQRHTVISAAGMDIDALLDHALDFYDRTAPHDAQTAQCVREALECYLRTAVCAGKDHSRSVLARMIDASGCLGRPAA
jgi:hypothetical protein